MAKEKKNLFADIDLSEGHLTAALKAAQKMDDQQAINKEIDNTPKEEIPISINPETQTTVNEESSNSINLEIEELETNKKIKRSYMMYPKTIDNLEDLALILKRRNRNKKLKVDQGELLNFAFDLYFNLRTIMDDDQKTYTDDELMELFTNYAKELKAGK